MATRYRTNRTTAADSKLSLRVDVDIFTGDSLDAADETLLRLAGNIFQLGTRVGIDVIVTATHPDPATLPALGRIRSWFGQDITVDYHELITADAVGVDHGGRGRTLDGHMWDQTPRRDGRLARPTT